MLEMIIYMEVLARLLLHPRVKFARICLGPLALSLDFLVLGRELEPADRLLQQHQHDHRTAQRRILS